MTEPLDLDALEALAEAATPGPWEKGEDERFLGIRGDAVAYAGVEPNVCVAAEPVDAAFIAAARTAVPALAARVREAEKGRDEAERMHEEDCQENDLLRARLEATLARIAELEGQANAKD